MTREQSKKIQDVERIVDYLSDIADCMVDNNNFRPLNICINGSILPCEGYREDVEALNAKVHDYELALLNELKGKYLKIYAEL